MTIDKNIKAETWLSVHFPSRKEWIARKKSIFSRNYSGDLRSCQPEYGLVELSRDGLYDIFPNFLFYTGSELEKKNLVDFKWIEKVLKQRRERIRTVFQPFDSSFFNHSLAIEKEVNSTVDDKVGILVAALTGKDFSKEPNKYIRGMAPFVLQAAKLRGDYNTLCGIITCLLNHNTTYRLKNKKVRFVVNNPDLSHDEFVSYMEELKPFFKFVEEWFVPFELNCECKVRDYGRKCRFKGNNKLMLDYNATL